MPEKETSTASTAREEPRLMCPWWEASSASDVVGEVVTMSSLRSEGGCWAGGRGPAW